MAKKKKKHDGHYCKICGEYKANEKFSGKGHAKHICKECWSLPDDVKADMMRCNDVERLFGKYPFSRQDWEMLEKYAKKYAGKESGQFAQSILDDRRHNNEEDAEPEEEAAEPIPYAGLPDYDKDTVMELFNEITGDFLCGSDEPPGEPEFREIMAEVVKDAKDFYAIHIQPDEEFEKTAFETIREIIQEMESDEEPF